MDKFFERALCICFYLLSLNSFSQVSDSLIYDIDGFLYKKISFENEEKCTQYYDSNGKQGRIQELGGDSLESAHKGIVLKLIAKEIEFPRDFLIESKSITKDNLRFWVSFLVEEDGSVTNLRIIGSFPDSINTETVFPKPLELPKLDPVVTNGKPAVVERLDGIVISCFCAPIRHTVI